MYGARIWTTANNQRLRWSEMTPSHLRNCARFIRKRAANEVKDGYLASAYLHGEAACDFMDSEINFIEERAHQANILASEMEAYASLKEKGLK